MHEESVFGLGPEQLDRLMSLGADDEPAETEKYRGENANGASGDSLNAD